MKKFIIIATLVAYAALYVWAGQYRVVTLLDGANASFTVTNALGIITNTVGTNNVIAANTNATAKVGTSNAITKAILVNGCCVGIFTSFKMVAAATAGPTFTMQKSYDGTNWESVGITFTNAANGTTPVSYWTNFPIGQFGYVRVSQITNNAAVALTNLVVRWYNKEDTH